MGSIYKRGRNYYIDIRSGGRRIRKKVGPSKRLAELVLKDAEVQIARNQFNFNAPDRQILDLLKSFIEYSKTNHRPKTTIRYNNVVNNFQIFLQLKYPNVVKISQLNPGLFEKFKDFRIDIDPKELEVPEDFPFTIPNNCNKAKKRTLNFELKVLRSIFSYGMKNGFCRANPCKDVLLLKIMKSTQPSSLSDNSV